MFIKTANALVSIAELRYDETISTSDSTTAIARYLRGSIDRNEFEIAVAPIVDMMVASVRDRDWLSGASKVQEMRAGGLFARIDHPFSTNTLIGDTFSDEVYQSNRMKLHTADLHTFETTALRLASGVAFQTPVASLIGCFVHKKLQQRQLLRTDLTSNQLNNANDAAQEQERQILSIWTNPHHTHMMAEEAIAVHDGVLYIHRQATTAFTSLLTQVNHDNMPGNIPDTVSRFQSTGVWWYKYASDATGTVEEIAEDLEAAGVSAWLSEDLPWIALPITKYSVIQLRSEEIILLRENLIDWVAMYPLFAKWFFNHASLTGEGVIGTFVDMIKATRWAGNTKKMEITSVMPDSWYDCVAGYLRTVHQDVTDVELHQVFSFCDFMLAKFRFSETSRDELPSDSDQRHLIPLIQKLGNTMPETWPQEVRDITAITENGVEFQFDAGRKLVMTVVGASVYKADFASYLSADPASRVRTLGYDALRLLNFLERVWYTCLSDQRDITESATGDVTALISAPQLVGHGYPFIQRGDSAIHIPIEMEILNA